MNTTAQEMKRQPEATQADGGADLQTDRSTQGASATEQSEGAVARTIEQQTAKLPSDLFLWGAIGGIAVSALFQIAGHKDKSRFFGQWVAPMMLFGVYNKIVKTQGSDRASA